MRGRQTICLGVAAATLMTGCLLDWDSPRPVKVPADRGVDVRPPDAAPADLAPDQRIWDDAYPEDSPRPDAAAPDLPDAAAPDLLDAAPPDLTPPDAKPPDTTPVCAYHYIAGNSVTSFSNLLNQYAAAGWQLRRYNQDTPGHSVLLVDSSGTYTLNAKTNPATLASDVNAAVALGQSIVTFGANVTAHAIWLEGAKGGYKALVTASTSPAALLNKELGAGWKVHSFTDTAAAYHSVWLAGAGGYVHLSTNSSTNLNTAVASQVSLGYTPVAYLSNNIHAIWLRQGSSYELYATSSSSAATVAATVTGKVNLGASVEAFASASGPHSAWLRKGSSYLLRQASFGGSLEQLVNQDVAAGWAVQALLSRDKYSAWLKNSYCP